MQSVLKITGLMFNEDLCKALLYFYDYLSENIARYIAYTL